MNKGSSWFIYTMWVGEVLLNKRSNLNNGHFHNDIDYKHYNKSRRAYLCMPCYLLHAHEISTQNHVKLSARQYKQIYAKTYAIFGEVWRFVAPNIHEQSLIKSDSIQVIHNINYRNEDQPRRAIVAAFATFVCSYNILVVKCSRLNVKLAHKLVKHPFCTKFSFIWIDNFPLWYEMWIH